MLEKPCPTNQIIGTASKAIASHKAFKLAKNILDRFSSFTSEVKTWSDHSLDHMVQLENQLYQHGIRKTEGDEIQKDLHIRKGVRQSEENRKFYPERY